ncbi:hypothetical protein ACH5RR_020912 [Cinchona calisaya]|uniref:PGG domain-containing protein n=1 Tax=Cinchona calisaya TaxID=153742 RepID=A0ABD2ZFX5_9GENT
MSMATLRLHEAARFGEKRVADIMLRREKGLVSERNNLGETPLFIAAACGKKEVFTFLENFNSDCMMRRNDGCTILHAAVIGECYSLAIRILESYPDLAGKRNEKRKTALHLLAEKPESFRSGSSYAVGIPEFYKESLPDNSAEEQNKSEDTDFEGSQFGISSQKKNRVPDPLIHPTRLDIIEVAKEILRAYPEAAYTSDENGRNILQIVVEKKHRILYDYLMGSGSIFKDRMLSDIDFEGNSIIHLAAGLGSPASTSYGVMLQMMWHVFWFKRVKYDCFPSLWQLQNSSGKTALQEFEDNHETLRKDAEKSIKDLSNYVLIVAVFIATINFAAVFTVPEGFEEKSGNPVYLKNKHWKFDLLMVYLAGGLFSSLFTMGTLLGSIFLQFTAEDFYADLPIKYVITSTTMFYSAGFTILAACQAYIVEAVAVWNVLPVLVVILAYIMMAFVFMDTSYLIFDYMCYLIRYSLYYRRQET